jgi:putative flippase GtrA
VSAIAGLYARFRHLIHEVAKFGIVGGVGFVVSLVGADVLRYDFHAGKYKAIAVATILATIVTFVGNRYWTYRNRPHVGTARESTMFFVLNGVGLAIQWGAVALVVDGLGKDTQVWYNLANFAGIVIGTIFRFFTYRKFVWKAPVETVLEGHEALEPTGTPTASAGSAADHSGQAAGE